MIALDNSEHSEKAFETGLTLAKPARNDVIILTSCIPPRQNAKNFAKLKTEAESSFQKYKEICSEKGLKAETLLLEQNDPREALCNAAEQRHIDMLVVGTRGLGAIKRALLGSVSSHLVEYCNCDVVVAK